MRTAADLLFCCLRRQSSAHAMWRVRLAAARLFLIKYILHPAPANAYRKHISCCRPHTISSHHRHALENRSTYTHTPPPGHASTHSLAGGEWARIRYTALNEQPGHEMKPLLSSQNPQLPVATGHGRVPVEWQDWLHCSLNGNGQLIVAGVRQKTYF